MVRSHLIPVVDIFAGPGGLSEGFCSYPGRGSPCFDSVLSIEKDAQAHATLQLRAFQRGCGTKLYHRFVRGKLTEQELYRECRPAAEEAEERAWCLELGPQNRAVVRDRIRKALLQASGGDWVLLGGPPCQPFSLAGRARNKRGTRYSNGGETRHTLYREYLQVIADHSPAVFVMENVRGLGSARYDGRQMFELIQDDLMTPGRSTKTGNPASYSLYSIVGLGALSGPLPAKSYVVRSEDYGVPQARHRLILLGVRDDIGKQPAPLKPRPGSTVDDALAGLPMLRSGLTRGDDADAWREQLRRTECEEWLAEVRRLDRDVYDKIVCALREIRTRGPVSRGDLFVRYNGQPPWKPTRGRNGLDGVRNHEARGHMPADLHRYLFCASFAKVHGRSPNLRDFPESLYPAHRSVRRAIQTGSNFSDRFRVQVADKPATTVVSHIAKDGHYYIHPDPVQCRSLTVREAARLQTFPDDYVFLGNRTQQYAQVGNAVPPLLARQIAEIVAGILGIDGS